MAGWWMGVALLLCAPGSAATEAEVTNPAPVMAATPPSAPATSPEDDVRRKLEGTRWALAVTPLAGAGEVKGYRDTVTFTAQQMTSEQLSAAGYPSPRYAVTLEGGEVVVWEAAQIKAEAGIAFWRGEFHEEALQGILNKHPLEGASEYYSFTGTLINEAASAAQPPPEAQSQSSAPRASHQKTARKGWWGRR